jgi:hypothetical protein
MANPIETAVSIFIASLSVVLVLMGGIAAWVVFRAEMDNGRGGGGTDGQSQPEPPPGEGRTRPLRLTRQPPEPPGTVVIQHTPEETDRLAEARGKAREAEFFAGLGAWVEEHFRKEGDSGN